MPASIHQTGNHGNRTASGARVPLDYITGFDQTRSGSPVERFPSVTIASTRVEKLITVMRRTAAVLRNAERKDDESLVRHIYDHFKITEAFGTDVSPLIKLAQTTIAKDTERYGNQHLQLRETQLQS